MDKTKTRTRTYPHVRVDKTELRAILAAARYGLRKAEARTEWEGIPADVLTYLIGKYAEEARA